jgi:Flp pilus assembly protein TadD
MRAIVALSISAALGGSNSAAQSRPPGDDAGKGIQLAAEGNWKAAEIELRKAMEQKPNEPRILAALGTVLLQRQKTLEAVTYLEKAVEIAPADVGIRLDLAKAEWQAGKLQAAQSNLQMVLKHHPNDSKAIMLLGMVAERSGDFAEAAKLLRSVPLALRTEPLADAALASACYHKGTSEQARLCMAPIQNASPEGIFMAATAAADAGDFATAEAMLLSIRPFYQDRYALDYQLALVQYHAGDIAASQATLTDMIAKREDSGDTHNLLGWCWFKRDNLNQAEQELNEAIRLDPSSETNYLDLARMQLAGRQLDAALDSARLAVKLFPKSSEGWLVKGSIETLAQRLADALTSYTTAVRLDGNNAEAELALANAQWLAGKTEQARASFHLLLQRYPRTAQVYVAYADFLSNVGPRNPAQLRGLMTTALALDSSLAEPHYYLGNSALTNGKVDEAVQQLEIAAQLDPASSKTHFALSRALRQQGRREESERELGIYQELKAAEEGASRPGPTPLSDPAKEP